MTIRFTKWLHKAHCAADKSQTLRAKLPHMHFLFVAQCVQLSRRHPPEHLLSWPRV